MEINITDLSPDRFFVRLNENFAEKINTCVTARYSSFKRLAKIINLWSGSLYTWRKNSSYPLSVLIEICKLCDIDLKNEQQGIVELRSCVYRRKNNGNAKSKPIYPKFPIRLTPELSSLIAHLFCDGSLSIDKNGYVHIQYYNTDRILLKEFKNNARKIFGDFDIYESKNKGISFLALPTPIG